MFSDRGRSYQNRLRSYIAKTNKGREQPRDINSSMIDNVGSIQFYLTRGNWVKFYRKTKDHIRFEIGFEKPYIKKYVKTHKGNSTCRYLSAYPVMLHHAKNILKRADPAAIIEYSNRTTSEDKILEFRLQQVYDYLELYDPKLKDLIVHYSAGRPIDDNALKQYIRRKPMLKDLYVKDIMHLKDKTISVYKYDPQHRIKMEQRKQLKEPELKTSLEKTFSHKLTYEQWKMGDLKHKM